MYGSRFTRPTPPAAASSAARRSLSSSSSPSPLPPGTSLFSISVPRPTWGSGWSSGTGPCSAGLAAPSSAASSSAARPPLAKAPVAAKPSLPRPASLQPKDLNRSGDRLDRAPAAPVASSGLSGSRGDVGRRSSGGREADRVQERLSGSSSTLERSAVEEIEERPAKRGGGQGESVSSSSSLPEAASTTLKTTGESHAVLDTAKSTTSSASSWPRRPGRPPSPPGSGYNPTWSTASSVQDLRASRSTQPVQDAPSSGSLPTSTSSGLSSPAAAGRAASSAGEASRTHDAKRRSSSLPRNSQGRAADQLGGYASSLKATPLGSAPGSKATKQSGASSSISGAAGSSSNSDAQPAPSKTAKPASLAQAKNPHKSSYAAASTSSPSGNVSPPSLSAASSSSPASSSKVSNSASSRNSSGSIPSTTDFSPAGTSSTFPSSQPRPSVLFLPTRRAPQLAAAPDGAGDDPYGYVYWRITTPDVLFFIQAGAVRKYGLEAATELAQDRITEKLQAWEDDGVDAAERVWDDIPEGATFRTFIGFGTAKRGPSEQDHPDIPLPDAHRTPAFLAALPTMKRLIVGGVDAMTTNPRALLDEVASVVPPDCRIVFTTALEKILEEQSMEVDGEEDDEEEAASGGDGEDDSHDSHHSHHSGCKHGGEDDSMSVDSASGLDSDEEEEEEDDDDERRAAMGRFLDLLDWGAEERRQVSAIYRARGRNRRRCGRRVPRKYKSEGTRRRPPPKEKSGPKMPKNWPNFVRCGLNGCLYAGPPSHIREHRASSACWGSCDCGVTFSTNSVHNGRPSLLRHLKTHKTGGLTSYGCKTVGDGYSNLDRVLLLPVLGEDGVTVSGEEEDE
ncbi:hypothetical protein JCM8097_006609 [Rhodosporidiobolus ruineniae]